jgi:putative redox protein
VSPYRSSEVINGSHDTLHSRVIPLRTYPDLVAVVKKEDGERRSLAAEEIGTHRIDVQLIEQLRFEASFGNFSFTIDEPPERGGTDAGLPPLSYFLAGAVSCLLAQYAKLALAKNVPLTSMKAVARGHFDRRVGGAFKDIIYEIAIVSPAGADAIGDIAREAELFCYAHNTLKNSVHMQTNLTLNGERLDFRE